MNQIYIPIKNNSNFKILQDNEENMVIASKFTFGRNLNINKCSKLILKACDGKNTVENIVKIIMNAFNESNYNMVKDDVYHTLNTFWKYGIISWKNNINPEGEKFYIKDKDYKIEIINHDTTDSFLKIKTGFEYTSPYFDKKTIICKDSLDIRIITEEIRVFSLKINDLDAIKIILNIDEYSLTGTIEYLWISEEFNSYRNFNEIFEKFINLISLNIISKIGFISSDCKNFYLNSLVLANKDKSKSTFEKIGFITQGVLKKDCTFGDLTLLVYKINIQ